MNQRPSAARRWLNRLAQVFMLCEPEWDGEAMRTSHLMQCEACGWLYIEHAADPREPYLNVLCDGRRVKL